MPRLLPLASATAPPASPQRVQERGVDVHLGAAFYRPQSCFSRDLAVLSAVVHRRHQQAQQRQHAGGGAAASPPLHVLDLMGGSGIRSMRYLLQAGADHVLCNDGDAANAACLEANLQAAAAQLAAAAGGGAGGVRSAPAARGGRQWRLQGRAADGAPPPCELVHDEASALLARCRLEGRFFDLIDSDSFGASSHVVGAALGALRFGGLLCLTSTAGTIAGGRDPASALALYAQHLAPVPFANEQGLRSLIGLAHREALARRLTIRPLWSLYSSHGPVFRAMLHVGRQQQRQHQRQKQRQQQQAEYGYTLHWPGSGESACCSWHDMPAALQAAAAAGGEPALLSGPLWLGPLHDPAHLAAVRDEAESRGWLQPPGAAAGGADAGPVLPATRKGNTGSLEQLLGLMLEEAAAEEAAARQHQERQEQQGEQQQQQLGEQHAAPAMPPWFIRMNDVGRVGALVGPPSRDKLVAELQRRGHVAARSHIDFAGVKTTANMAQAVEAAVALGCARRGAKGAAVAASGALGGG